jgi:hypothetical protein
LKTKEEIAQIVYTIIQKHPGIREDCLRGILGLDIQLFEDDLLEDRLDGILADCSECGYLLSQEEDRIYAE